MLALATSPLSIQSFSMKHVADKSEPDFMADDPVQDGVIRSRLIHDYINVNLDVMWDSVEKVLPEFLTKVNDIQGLIRKLPSQV